MNLISTQQAVREFHEKHGYARDLLDPRRATDHNWFEIGVHRSHLIAEEHGELMAAWAKRDPVAIADGLADLVYVVLGTAVAVGVELGPIFAEVHRSNMTKDTANQFVLHPHKGPTYSPPNLRPIMIEHGLI